MLDTPSTAVSEGLALEMSLIGALTIQEDGRADVLSKLDADVFTDPRARTAFQAINRMAVNGHHIDLVTLRDELRVNGLTAEAGGAEWLADTFRDCPNHEEASEYAGRLIQQAIKRRTYKALMDTAKAIQSGDLKAMDPAVIYDRIMRAAKVAGADQTLYWMEAMLQDWNPDQHKECQLANTVAQTGIFQLDSAISIFRPSNFTVLAARPGVGKSTLMRQTAMEAAKTGPVLLFSLEESKEQVRDKMLCALAQVDYSAWYNGHSSEADTVKLVTAAGHLATLPIAIYGGYSVDAARVKLVTRSMIEAGKKPGAVFVDHLQLMSHPKSATRDEAVGETTRQFRLTSLELDVPIVLLCQMNRAADARGNEEKRPRLSDLRESGSIEANAPNVMFLWRASTALEDSHKITLSLAKHRDGPTMETELIFQKVIGVFGGRVAQEGFYNG